MRSYLLLFSAPEIVSGMSGESEQKVRELFEAAASRAPAIIFIDEVKKERERERVRKNISHVCSSFRLMLSLRSVKELRRIWKGESLHSYYSAWMR
jgi:SpoVK/Ycf46/Vps4 family AAA+-type ATPase